MTVFSKLRCSIAAGTAAAVMLSSLPPVSAGSCLFFPSFIIGACSCQTEEEEAEPEYGFAIIDFFVSLFS